MSIENKFASPVASGKGGEGIQGEKAQDGSAERPNDKTALEELEEKANEVLADPEKFSEEDRSALVSALRENVTKEYSKKTLEISVMQKYLAMAEEIEQSIIKEKKEWKARQELVESGEFGSPLSSEEFSFIKLTRFVCASEFLELNGETKRKINGILVVFETDEGDERARGFSKINIVEDLTDDRFPVKKNASLRRSMERLQKKLLELVKLEGEEKALIHFCKDDDFSSEEYNFKIARTELVHEQKKGKENEKEQMSVKKGIEESVDAIIKDINETHYQEPKKIASVGDGGKRYNRR